ncbi:MAG: hypothetical protein WC333_02135 [Dehalococcoidia bacterium]|jgi:hypothetical protein
MNKPKLELKKIKTFRGMEGYGLNADLYINGVKCYFVLDEGNGGEIDFQPELYQNPKAEQVKANIKLLDEYIATLPEQELFTDDKGKKHTYKPDLSFILDELINEQEKAKVAKKMEKLFETAICFGVPNSGRYRYITWKNKKPLSAMPKIIIQGEVNRIKAKECKDGVVILNTNLQSLGIIL